MVLTDHFTRIVHLSSDLPPSFAIGRATLSWSATSDELTSLQLLKMGSSPLQPDAPPSRAAAH
jgi:hypothetical protein